MNQSQLDKMRLFQTKLDKTKLKQLIEGGTDAKVN